MTAVLVFVPGLLGSELWDGDNKVWPGNGWDAVVGFSENEFQRLLKDELEPKSIIRTAVGGFVDIYEDWIERFESLRSTADNKRMFSEANRTLVTVPYDWRKPAQLAAQLLATAIDTAVKDKGADTEIILTCHSLGGLVARYYLQSGTFDKTSGFKNVNVFATFGTPHNGAPIALAGVTGKHRTNFLSVEQSTRLANDPRFPSLYQTFPDPNHPLIWQRASGGRLQPTALGDEEFALQRLKLRTESYEAYLQFRSDIDKPYPNGVRRFVLMGTRFDTITHFFWDGENLAPVRSKDGGDGTVSIPAAYLPNVQCRLTGEAHVSLIRSDECRQTFQELMGATGMLRAGVQQIEVSTRDVVIDMGAAVELVILTDRVDSVSGEITIEGAPVPADEGTLPGPGDFKPLKGRAPQPFSYRGPTITGASMSLPGIGTPGLYRVVISSSTGALLAQSPIFVVSGTH
jgi:Lecithin:cholesterol acyltransferase